MSVNWEEQWALFAPNFKNGKAHIPLKGVTLELLPGGGFGDFYHPTTQLMVEALENEIHNEAVVDIGTGSGILSIAALLLGARSAIGIDIDPEAIEHAKKNSLHNQVSNRFQILFGLPLQIEPSIFLMNMIFPEQKKFSPERWNQSAKKWITSGIRLEEKEEYLQTAKKWGWTPIQEREKDGWMCWVFNCTDFCRKDSKS